MPTFTRIIRKLTTGPWYGLGAIAVGGSSVGLLATFVQTPTQGHDKGNFPGWATVLVLTAILVAIFGAMLLSEWDRLRKWRSSDRRSRISELTSSLQDALTFIDSIRIEIEKGQLLLSDLENKASYQRELANLSPAEAKAVHSVLQEELRSQERTSFVRNSMVAGAFFGLGIAFNIFIR